MNMKDNTSRVEFGNCQLIERVLQFVKYNPEIYTDESCNNLFINLNNLVYTSIVNLNDTSGFEKLLSEKISENIYTLISKYKPTNLVYFALDGVLPKSKILSKRQIISKLNTKTYTKDSTLKYRMLYKKKFYPEELSSNTEFIINVRTLIYQIINDLKNIYTNIKFIFSDDSSPSTCEYKISSYIRKNYNKQHKNVVYSLTDEMFVFSANYYYKDIRIIHSNYYNLIINTKDVFEKYFQYFSTKLPYLSLSKTSLMLDFILLHSMILSEFLPSFDNKINNFNNLMSVYLLYLNKTIKYIHLNDKIDFNQLKKFLELYYSHLTNKFSIRHYSFEELSCIQKYEKYSNHKVYNYLKSLYWIFLYYTKYSPSYNWAYLYYSVPNLEAIINYIASNTLDLNKIHFLYTAPTKPIYQLYSISSYFYMKENYKDVLMKNIEKYPLEFREIDNLNIIPFIDPYKLI